jgi:short subunit dehydrogenase-like uncharacterized protein
MHLALGFDSRLGFSPGTAKTSVEGLAEGGKVRKDGRIVSVLLAYKTRRIDFGDASGWPAATVQPSPFQYHVPPTPPPASITRAAKPSRRSRCSM